MTTRLFPVATAGLLLASLLATAAYAIEPKDLVGKYTCKGVNTDNSKFDHPVDITVAKGNTLLVYYDSDDPDIGLGIVKGNTLTVRFQGVKDPKRTGEAHYELQDGVWKGMWHYTGDKKMPESLKKK